MLIQVVVVLIVIKHHLIIVQQRIPIINVHIVHHHVHGQNHRHQLNVLNDHIPIHQPVHHHVHHHHVKQISFINHQQQIQIFYTKKFLVVIFSKIKVIVLLEMHVHMIMVQMLLFSNNNNNNNNNSSNNSNSNNKIIIHLINNMECHPVIFILIIMNIILKHLS